MKNCLVVPLNGEVNNDNLPIFGNVVFAHVKQGTVTDGSVQQHFGITPAQVPAKIKVIGTGGYFATTFEGLADPSSRLTEYEITEEGFKDFYVANADFDIAIEDYNLAMLSTKGASGKINIVYTDLKNLKDCLEITSLNLSYSDSIGSLDDIKHITGFTGIQALTLISTKITGSIESFVAGQVAAGVTQKSFGISKILNGFTTFKNVNSQPINTGILQWDGANKIILYIGNAIKIEECTIVYETGATAEEIAAWQEAGKTVTDVDTGTVYPRTN